MADVAIQFKDVNKWYGKLQVLSAINLSVAGGEVVVVCGPSGSGKSTLIRCVNGLEGIQGGDLVVLGESIMRRGVSMSALRTRVGMVFQSFNLFPHMTVLENITCRAGSSSGSRSRGRSRCSRRSCCSTSRPPPSIRR